LNSRRPRGLWRTAREMRHGAGLIV